MVFGVLPWLFLLAANVPLLAVIIFVVGLGIAPTLITAFEPDSAARAGCGADRGPGLVLHRHSMGYGIVSAFVGRIADSHGARPAFLVTIGCGLALGVSAAMLHRRLARRPVAPQPVSVGPE